MREFIEKMRENGLVIDVEEPVSADMQAPKMAASTDKLLFFHKIEGARAVMNLTASRRALSIALGIDERKMVKTLIPTARVNMKPRRPMRSLFFMRALRSWRDR